MAFTISKLNKLSKEESIEELLGFDNFPEKINDLTKKMDDFTTKFDVFSDFQDFQNLYIILYYTNKLLIWRDRPWIILNI